MTFTEATNICAEQEQLIGRQIEAIQSLSIESTHLVSALRIISRAEINQRDSDGDCQSCFEIQRVARDVLKTLEKPQDDQYAQLVAAIHEINESSYQPFNAVNLVVRSSLWAALLEMIGHEQAAQVGE